METKAGPAVPLDRPPVSARSPDPPFQGPGLLARTAPFAIAAVLAEASLTLQSGPLPVAQVVISLVLLVATAAAFLLPWQRLPDWSHVLVPLAYTGSVLALTLAAGPDSGVGIVILIPLVWTALFHRRWESGCIVAATVAVEAVISVAQDAPDAVTARRVILWALLGVMISVAIHGLRDRIQRSQQESARLEHRIRELTVLADRDRIARGLNEGVVQRVLTAATRLQGVALLAGDAEVRRRVEATINDLDDAARTLRQTIFGLGALNAEPTVGQVIREFCAALSPEPVVVLDGPVDSLIPASVENQILDTLREAVEVITAPARLTQVGIAVDDSVRLTVVGSGGELDATEPDGRFPVLREHAHRAGVSIEIEAVPGGRRVCWRFPLTDPIGS